MRLPWKPKNTRNYDCEWKLCELNSPKKVSPNNSASAHQGRSERCLSFLITFFYFAPYGLNQMIFGLMQFSWLPQITWKIVEANRNLHVYFSVHFGLVFVCYLNFERFGFVGDVSMIREMRRQCRRWNISMAQCDEYLMPFIYLFIFLFLIWRWLPFQYEFYGFLVNTTVERSNSKIHWLSKSLKCLKLCLSLSLFVSLRGKNISFIEHSFNGYT